MPFDGKDAGYVVTNTVFEQLSEDVEAPVVSFELEDIDVFLYMIQ